MILELTRFGSSPMGTFGDLLVGSVRMYSVENPWRGNAFNVSCIPAGFYRLSKFTSQLHPNSYLLHETDPRTAILIHPGNTDGDTEGCILPGLTLGTLSGRWSVQKSRDAMSVIRDANPDGILIRWQTL